MDPIAPPRADQAHASDADRREAVLACLQRMAKGDRVAFETLYRLTSGRLHSLVYRLLRNQTATEDVLQEVYLKVWRQAERFDPDRAGPMAWLSTIARNAAIDRMRADPRRFLPMGEDTPEPVDESAGALDLLVAEGERTRLSACLGEIDSTRSELIRAAYFGGMTYEALAKARGLPLGTVKDRIRRGLRALRACLER